MKRAILAATVMAAALASLSAAIAQQRLPGDTGSPEERGIQSLNNSGQVGFVTLHPRGERTSIVLDLHSAKGRVEPAHVHRGKDCIQADVDPTPAYPLKDVVNERSVTTIDAPMAKLLSGNYVIIIHASAKNINHYVACAQLSP
ncbi:MAG: hypothetical protein JO140_03160 [Candidatus Eremiobacteraeota bacterium]|nr:hypothetical protein [Candidatus Eremiobacteraeota bacterium]